MYDCVYCFISDCLNGLSLEMQCSLVSKLLNSVLSVDWSKCSSHEHRIIIIIIVVIVLVHGFVVSITNVVNDVLTILGREFVSGFLPLVLSMIPRATASLVTDVAYLLI